MAQFGDGDGEPPPPPLIPLIGVPGDGYGAEGTSGSPLPVLFVRVSPQNAAFAQGCVGVVAMLRCLGVLLRCRGAALHARLGEGARRKGAA